MTGVRAGIASVLTGTGIGSGVLSTPVEPSPAPCYASTPLKIKGLRLWGIDVSLKDWSMTGARETRGAWGIIFSQITNDYQLNNWGLTGPRGTRGAPFFHKNY